MPTDLTLVLRKSANWAETAFASGGSDGRSALVGDRALASSSGMSRLWIREKKVLVHEQIMDYSEQCWFKLIIHLQAHL